MSGERLEIVSQRKNQSRTGPTGIENIHGVFYLAAREAERYPTLNIKPCLVGLCTLRDKPNLAPLGEENWIPIVPYCCRIVQSGRKPIFAAHL
jgi:hypothetical protein